jgi:hypothetical protein
MIPAFVGEIDTIPAFQIRARNEFALYDLRPRCNVEQFPRAVVKHILHERRTVELLRGKPFQEIALPVV